jgi:integrase
MKRYPVTHATPAGNVVERGEQQFFVRLYVGKAADGTRKYYSKTWKTLERATQDLLEQKLNRSRGVLEIESSMKLGDYLKQYLEEVHRPRVSANTYAISAQFVKNYLYPYAVCGRRLKDLTAGDLQKYFNQLCAWVSPVTGRTLAPATVERLCRVVTAALNYAYNSQVIARNPMRGVALTSRRARRARRRALTREDLLSLLSYVDDNAHKWWIGKLGPIYHLAAETGFRPEEYLALQWKDCRLESDPPTLTVERVVVELKAEGGWTFADPKTEKSARTLPITRELSERLKEHRAVIAELRRRAGDKWREHDLVFPARFGNPVRQDVTERVFRKVCEELGWEKGRYCVYALRHSMASLALLRNVNLKVVSERLGHTSIRTTADVYAHVAPSLQAAATEEIGCVLYGEKKPRGGEDLPDAEPAPSGGVHEEGGSVVSALVHWGWKRTHEPHLAET